MRRSRIAAGGELRPKRRLGAALAGMLLVAIGPGARAQDLADAEPRPTATLSDPWEGLNRQTYGLNTGLDRAVFAPVTRGYVAVTPGPLRRGLGLAFDNLREPRIVINSLAQGYPRRALRSAARFAINSTVGVVGLFDVATRAGLPVQIADFGQTLGRYGVRPGPYVMVPILGPHDVRDLVGRVVDSLLDPASQVFGGLTTKFGIVRQLETGLDYRSGAEPALKALDDAADPYATARSAYSQRRAYIVRQATGEAETLPDFDEDTGAR